MTRLSQQWQHRSHFVGTDWQCQCQCGCLRLATVPLHCHGDCSVLQAEYARDGRAASVGVTSEHSSVRSISSPLCHGASGSLGAFLLPLSVRLATRTLARLPFFRSLRVKPQNKKHTAHTLCTTMHRCEARRDARRASGTGPNRVTPGGCGA
jgi:hypothetical protein